MEGEDITIAKYPLIQTKWGEVDTKIEILRDVAQQQGSDLKGFTVDKNTAKYTMAKLTNQIAGCAFSYATTQNNASLASVFKMSRYKILKLADDRAELFCADVLAKCRLIAVELEDYMVTSDDLDSLEEAINTFAQTRRKKGDVTSTSEMSSEMVDKILKEISHMFTEHLDKYVNKIEEDEPSFYSKYFSARKIHDL